MLRLDSLEEAFQVMLTPTAAGSMAEYVAEGLQHVKPGEEVFRSDGRVPAKYRYEVFGECPFGKFKAFRSTPRAARRTHVRSQSLFVAIIWASFWRRP